MSLLLFWPGFAMYDSVAQYAQTRSGEYTDWHPPAMARLWAVLDAAFGGGAEPMLVVQMGLYWLGLGLIAAALTRLERGVAAAAVLVIGVWPPFLGWLAAVLKDAQMAGAMLTAVGLVAHWRLRERAVPRAAWAAVALLLGYATLVRANAVFAVAPLAVMLVPKWSAWRRVGVGVVATVLVLAASGPINHRLLGAEPTSVVRSQAIYDLAGIASRVPGADDLPIDAPHRRALIDKHCVSPFFWDPLGSPTRCDAVVEPLRDVAVSTLYFDLASAASRHPIAYVSHRLAHLNSTDRWLVPVGWTSAAPPQFTQANDLGLGQPGAGARAFQRLAGWLVETPPAWPIVWIAVALVAVPVTSRRAAAPTRDLAQALLISALALELSFAGLSIASDLRYHLWSMLAVALSVVLLGHPRSGERALLIRGASLVAVVAATGTLARLALPPAPSSYEAMLRG